MSNNPQCSLRVARFSHVIGLGGIGTGAVIELDGDKTLGRTESRMGRLLDARDYCKLHIVEHYVAVLLGPQGGSNFCRVMAVGNVGRDDAGLALMHEMADAGIDTGYVRVEPNCKTLFSLSFLYPDKSGGNITINNSAAGELDQSQLDQCRRELEAAGPRAIALSLPEVPLEARSEFLRIATECGSFRIASFAAGEIETVRGMNLLSRVDILAVNREESASLGRATVTGHGNEEVLEACLQVAQAANPGIVLIVSGGAEGVDVFDQGAWSHHAAVPTEVVSSAGAGDALLGGVIAGIVQGLPLVHRTHDHNGWNKRETAIDLGLLVAAFSLTSTHTIHPGFSTQALREFATTKNTRLRCEDASRLFAAPTSLKETAADSGDR
jgi:sugar/nucleoside kinase (ribokinase family)